MSRLRRSEVVLACYFVYVFIVAVFRPVDTVVQISIGCVNALIAVVLYLLGRADVVAGLTPVRVARDWLPAPLILVAYKEMGWLALPRPGFETELSWVKWDRLVLGEWGVKAAIESLGPLLPSILEASYTLVYTTLPFAMAMLYLYGRRARMDRMLFPALLSVLGTYALFPYFPSEPPRTVFPGELFPAYETVFRKLNWWLLEGYGIHTSVFPSAHVSGAFASAFAARREIPEARWAGDLLLVMAFLIAAATVYCRYHYLVDALAGAAMAVAGTAVGRWWLRRAAAGDSEPL
jgi:membrane-associated phospholipid phosphatase